MKKWIYKGNTQDNDQFFFGPYHDTYENKNIVYFGQYSQGLKNKIGRVIFKNNYNALEGQFQSGKLHGNLRIVNRQGGIYQGS